jgi:hypothetical protein
MGIQQIRTEAKVPFRGLGVKCNKYETHSVPPLGGWGVNMNDRKVPFRGYRG